MSDDAPFLSAAWRHLVLLNYQLPEDLLGPYVPAGTVLDRHSGSAWASIVAFRFEDTRILGIPVPFHQSSEEINLRCYVKRILPGETRSGVVFIREAVPRSLVAGAARILFNEPYITMPMSSRLRAEPPELQYEWKLDGITGSLTAAAQGHPSAPPAESLEYFLTMKTWGYTRLADGGTL